MLTGSSLGSELIRNSTSWLHIRQRHLLHPKSVSSVFNHESTHPYWECLPISLKELLRSEVFIHTLIPQELIDAILWTEWIHTWVKLSVFRDGVVMTTWDGHKHCSRLQLIQNAAAGVLTRTKRSEHITPALKSLLWLPVSHRIDVKSLLMVYKSQNLWYVQRI